MPWQASPISLHNLIRHTHTAHYLRREQTYTHTHVRCSSDLPDGSCQSSSSARLPLSPETALKEFGPRLTQFERKEVREYEDIWFLGLDSKKTEGVEGTSQNSGNILMPSFLAILHPTRY